MAVLYYQRAQRVEALYGGKDKGCSYVLTFEWQGGVVLHSKGR